MSDTINESTVIGRVHRFDITYADVLGVYTVVNTEALGQLRKLADQVRAGDIADVLATLDEVPDLVDALTTAADDDA